MNILTPHLRLTLAASLALLVAAPAAAQRSYADISLFSAADTLHGVQIDGLLGAVRGEARGLQLAGLTAISGSINGAQIAGLTCATPQPLRGLQIAALGNIAGGIKRGVQLSAGANIATGAMRGVQAAMYNYADTVNGWQIGLVNASQAHTKGLQLGLINYSKDTTAHKLGLVNLTPLTRIDFLLGGGNITKTSFAVRFRNRSNYSIIGFGTHFTGFGGDFSGAITYRLGRYFNITPRLTLSGDLGFSHVESFHKRTAERPARLYSLQARINADYQIGQYLGAYASVGYADTRYYHHATAYRQRPLWEAGLSMRLARSPHNAEAIAAARYGWHDATADDDGSIYALKSDFSPKKQRSHPWLAALEVTGINALVQSFDRFVLDADFAQINLHTIHHNIKNGFVWDNDQFSTNLFAHPYHGGLYFNAARTNGLNFWQSVPYAVGGSLMWEMICEIEPPAINDLMATSFGGAAIGEMTYRLSSLILNDSKRGGARFWRELLATCVDPIRGLNRLISGDAFRVRHSNYRYHDYSRIPVDLTIGAGARYLADNAALFRGEATPYATVALNYGNPYNHDENRPYDYFTAEVRFQFSSNQPLISDVHILGRLWSAKVSASDAMNAAFGIFQHFNYYDSQPVKDGTSLVPYRISEAASVGPGLLCEFPLGGNLAKVEQRVFLDGILLGGSLTDYYNVIDRDYNLGSGYSAKASTLVDFGHHGYFSLAADYCQLFTWKGYEGKDLTTIDPLYLNSQSDKGCASLLVLKSRLSIAVAPKVSLDFGASYYTRRTHYSYHPDVTSSTWDATLGLSCRL